MFSNKFDPNTDVPDLSGKVYVVTGGSAGIGYGICAHLLQHNCAALYLLGNKEEHLQEASEGLKSYGDTSKLHPAQINLADLKDTDQVAKDLSSKLSRLDALILNAGLGVGPYEMSKDGIDTHMQVNVFAQHHLAMTLLPLLLATPSSRLVLQSSSLHAAAPSSSTNFQFLSEINQDLGPLNLYARSKLAQILLVRAFHARKQTSALGLRPNAPPWINATHPGAVSTDQPEQAVEAYGTLGKIGVKAVRPFMKEPLDEGCRSALFAATSAKVDEEKIDGQYLVPDGKVSDVSKQAEDEALGERLWRLTEEILTDRLGRLEYGVSHGGEKIY
ncbi:Hypothetical predicted protein [Lecanosticta acicola]|uniref:NAD(P)-binding protein n=1 Tax=Lecanosticta acicola TaxID=111012 RepID=A0AAI8Z1B3_9PEZI|nr:Hypothetical predicted protein [Lecanosticta acicola]